MNITEIKKLWNKSYYSAAENKFIKRKRKKICVKISQVS